MKLRKVDVSVELREFTGDVMMVGDKKDVPFTVKEVLCTYLHRAHDMGLTMEEQCKLYPIGMAIGTARGELELEQVDFDRMKRLVDNPTVAGRAVYPLIVTQQVKLIWDAAELIDKE